MPNIDLPRAAVTEEADVMIASQPGFESPRLCSSPERPV